MADEQNLAALRAQVAALETKLQAMQPSSSAATGAGTQPHVVHTHVFGQCFAFCYMPSPPIGDDDDAPMRQQLSHIEEQLDRVIALLEKQGA
jgi:hypothetical protein